MVSKKLVTTKLTADETFIYIKNVFNEIADAGLKLLNVIVFKQ